MIGFFPLLTALVLFWLLRGYPHLSPLTPPADCRKEGSAWPDFTLEDLGFTSLLRQISNYFFSKMGASERAKKEKRLRDKNITQESSEQREPLCEAALLSGLLTLLSLRKLPRLPQP